MKKYWPLILIVIFGVVGTVVGLMVNGTIGIAIGVGGGALVLLYWLSKVLKPDSSSKASGMGTTASGEKFRNTTTLVSLKKANFFPSQDSILAHGQH